MEPKLIEPGVKYFLDETLKICKKKKNEYNCLVLNLGLFIGFSLFLFGVLYYRYKGKRNNKEKNEEQQKWIIEKIKKMDKKNQKKELITNLPLYQNHHEIMTRNFYNM